MYKFVPNNCLYSMQKGNHKPNTIAQYAMKSTELRYQGFLLRFCTHRNESNCVFVSKQLLSAQKNRLNETVFSTHKNFRVRREQNFYTFLLLRFVTVMINTFSH